MTIAREQYKVGQGAGSSINVTFDTNVAEGSLLLCCVSFYGGTGTAVVTDNNSNSWTQIFENNYNGVDYGVLEYVENANSGSTTVTVEPSDESYFTVVIIEVSGILTSSSLDQSNDNTGSSTSADSGNITTTQADEYLIGVMAHDTGNYSLTEGGAWTLIFEEENQSSDMPISVSERIVSSTLTESYDVSISSSASWWAAIASFKAAEIGGGGVVRQVSQMYKIING